MARGPGLVQERSRAVLNHKVRDGVGAVSGGGDDGDAVRLVASKTGFSTSVRWRCLTHRHAGRQERPSRHQDAYKCRKQEIEITWNR